MTDKQQIPAQQMIQFLLLEAAQKDEEIRMLKLQLWAALNPVAEPEGGEANDDTV